LPSMVLWQGIFLEVRAWFSFRNDLECPFFKVSPQNLTNARRATRWTSSTNHDKTQG
jgi:hypothetical protein